jgi:DNA-directed RNA polymerase subunit RPC12/RpoP
MPSKSNPDPNAESDYDKLLKSIEPLAREMYKLQQKLKKMGCFAHDRELVECPHCGLQEDVTFEGKLITCKLDNPDEDFGLQFMALDKKEEWWRCPACGKEFHGEGFSE